MTAFSFNANAQELFTLSGKVTDGSKPFPDVNIVVKETQKGTTPKADGTFSLSLKKGTYTLLVSALSNPKEVKVV
ncbi:MAG: carboxypeptidase-like regulatory domain-containing protein, partial [Lutibacter sp.]|nr:carboxypeptidase-like regulatory domain-containing protein [Lutibacter sp.]